MKHKTTYANGHPKTYRMFIFIIIAAMTVFLNCLHTNAQDRIKISNDSVYYVYSDEEWNSKMCENVEKIMVILNKESAPLDIDGDQVLVYLMKSVDVEEVEPGIKLKPYLMIYKPEINTQDFLQEVEEEELKIEEWMYDLLHWNIKDTSIY